MFRGVTSGLGGPRWISWRDDLTNLARVRHDERHMHFTRVRPSGINMAHVTRKNHIRTNSQRNLQSVPSMLMVPCNHNAGALLSTSRASHLSKRQQLRTTHLQMKNVLVSTSSGASYDCRCMVSRPVKICAKDCWTPLMKRGGWMHGGDNSPKSLTMSPVACWPLWIRSSHSDSSSSPSATPPSPVPPRPSPDKKKPASANKDEGRDGKQQNNNNEDEDDDSRMSLLPRAFLWMIAAYATVTLLSVLMPNSDSSSEGLRFISWNEFVYEMLQNGEVEQIVIKPDVNLATVYLFEGAIIKGRRAGKGRVLFIEMSCRLRVVVAERFDLRVCTEHRTYHMMLPDVGKFEDKLRQTENELSIRPGYEVPVVVERNQEAAWLLILSLVAVSVMILWMFRSGSIKTPQISDMFSSMTKAKFTLLDPLTSKSKGVTFAEVAGLHEAKQEVMELVSYLKDQKRYRELGAKIPKGVLLLGPPGCGKTLLAKAIATEASVPFLSMAGTEFVEMIGGLGAARVRDLFKEARRRAPCIIYIDEIDAIGRRRSGGGGGGGGGGGMGGVGSGEEEQTLNQLLVEMDGMGTSEGVMVLSSTNRPDVLDRALQRPGRFDRHITIDLPTLSDRAEIFQVYLRKIKLNGNVEKFAQHFAKLTPGMTGADISNVVNESAIHAATASKSKVDRHDFEAALERVLAGPEKRTSVMSPAEKQIVAYHEAGHALVGWLLRHTDALMRVSIKPRTTHALGFAQYTPNERKLFSSEDLLERMAMALGGRAAEALIFNKVSTGAQDDLQKVTKMAYAQIRAYGMNANVGLVAFPEVDGDERAGFLKKPYSKRLAHIMDEEARKLIAQAYYRADEILREHKDQLVKVAECLLQREQLNYEDVELLIGPPPHGRKAQISPADWDSFQLEDTSQVTTPRDLPTSDGVPSIDQPETHHQPHGVDSEDNKIKKKMG